MSLFFHSYTPDVVADDLFATYGIDLKKWEDNIEDIKKDFNKYTEASKMYKVSSDRFLIICQDIFHLTKSICDAALPIPHEKLIDSDEESHKGLFFFLMMDTLIHQSHYMERSKNRKFKEEYVSITGSDYNYSNILKVYKLFRTSNIYDIFFSGNSVGYSSAAIQGTSSGKNTKLRDNEGFNFPSCERNTILMLAKYIKFNPFADYYSRARPYKTLVNYYNDLYSSVNNPYFCSAKFTDMTMKTVQPTDDDSKIAYVFTSYYLDQIFDVENLSYLTIELLKKSNADKNFTNDMRINAAKVLSLSYMIQNPFCKKDYIDIMISAVTSDSPTTNSYFNGNLYKQILGTVGLVSEPSTMTSNLMFCRRYIMYLSTTYLPVLSACFYVLVSRILGDNIIEKLSGSSFFSTLSEYYQNRWATKPSEHDRSFLCMQNDPWTYSDIFSRLYASIKEQFYEKDKYSNLKKMVSISLKDKDYLRLYLNNITIWQSINIRGIEVSELMNSTYAIDNAPGNYSNLFGYANLL